LFALLIMGLTTAAYAQFTQQVIVPSSSIEKPEDVGKRAHTNVRWLSNGSFEGSISPQVAFGHEAPPPGQGDQVGEYPASLGCVYNLVSPRVPGCNFYTASVNPTGGSKAIAIVDAYDAPNAASDLAYFSSWFGLPVPSSSTFQVVYASGTEPAYDAGWEVEESLDVQWAHAMAPNAKIYLVEAASNSFSDLYYAVSVASTLVAAAGGGEVSMSWGASEFSGEDSYDSYFQTSGVVYFAATGDAPGTSYPSASPYVVAVGGTSVGRNPATGLFRHETSWSEAGGGLSPYVSRPSYQNSIVGIVGPSRGVPDVSAIANPETPVWVYISDQGGWGTVGGTSVATPVMAGIVNSAGSFSKSTLKELQKIYNPLNIYFFDITQGYCGPYAIYVPGPGWDFCTGKGSPRTKLGK